MSDKKGETGPDHGDRYRTLFENVPIPIREEDLSQFKAKIDALGLSSMAALTHFLDDNPDFIDACGRAVRIVDANAASLRMYGYSDPEQLKSQVLQTFGPESRRFIRRAIEAIFLGETGDNQETAVYDKAGKRRTLVTNWSVVPGHEEDYSRSILCSVDITEKVEAQEALKQAQKMEALGQLTGGIAHDFNNLLAVIQGNVELLQAGTFEADERGELLSDIYGATRRGAELVRNMLAFSRRAELAPEFVRANLLVAETERWISRTMPPSIQIKTVSQGRLWPIQVDPSGLQSAIVNIMVNARDAMPEGGHLTIETSNTQIEDGTIDDSGEAINPGRYVLIAITDTGTGIPKDEQVRVFDPFYTTKDIGKGSGLGLSMVQGFVRQSGGAARVRSEVGSGTTFELYFPAVDASSLNAPTTRRAAHAPLTKATKKNIRILVVDDQVEILSLLVRVLSADGYTVFPIASGDAAFALFQQDSAFDLVLTDVAMPGKLQGPALVRAIREHDSEMPVVFLTGYAAEATVAGDGLRPTDIRLMKPVSRDDLLDAVSNALRTRRSIDEAQRAT